MFNLRSIHRNFPALKVVLNIRTSVLSGVKWGVGPKVYFRTFVLVEKKYDSKTQCPTLCILRSFSKPRNPINIPIDEQELSEFFDIGTVYSDFKKPLIYMRELFIDQLCLRNSSAIHQIKVKYEGKSLRVQDLANIRSSSSKEVVLDMGAFQGAIPNVMQALRNSPMNLSPERCNLSIIVPIGKVTREHRENLAKGAKKLFFNCRSSITVVQNKYIEKINGLEKLPKDKNFRLKMQMNLLCKKHIAEAQMMLSKKEEELLLPN